MYGIWRLEEGNSDSRPFHPECGYERKARD